MSLAAIWDFGPFSLGRAPAAPQVETVADFPVPRYSGKQVRKAGEIIVSHMPWVSDDDPASHEYRNAFKIAYDWRVSHAYPMRKIRQEMRSKIGALKAKGVTAARLKRMSSIRKKLTRIDANLIQIQDIGGCRAIVETQATLDALLAHFRFASPHKLRLDRSYVERPRSSGYRCHHLVLDFVPETAEEEVYRNRHIEIQLRTRVQHSWATAVEAIGLHRNEDMKGGEGDAEWLRFFELISSEFAEFEGAPSIPNAPEKSARLAEMQALDKKLSAVSTLETLNQAYRILDQNPNLSAQYYMIKFDHLNRTTEIVGYDKIIRATTAYGHAERFNVGTNSVVVEADTVSALKEVFPNYYLDVRLFAKNVVSIMKGEPLAEGVRRSEVENPAPAIDLSWLKTFRGKPRPGRK